MAGMDMADTYVLFKENKRVTFKIEDMRADRIARIFQVDAESLYLTDSNNVAIFPMEGGNFSSINLTERAHYEVHGGDGNVSTPNLGRPAVQATARPSFAFLQPSTATASPLISTRFTSPRSFQRSVHISEIRDGKLVPTSVVVVRFVESEASVPLILEKVQMALGNSDSYILTDSQGNEVVESEGTTGLHYWKQNSRKVHAVERSALQQWKQRRLGARGGTSVLQGVKEQIEELLEVSQGLDDVAKHIRDISDGSRIMREAQSRELKVAFTCLVCRGIMDGPMYAACCRSLVGCKVCIELWQDGSILCLKCRTEEPVYSEVLGLSAVLELLK